MTKAFKFLCDKTSLNHSKAALHFIATINLDCIFGTLLPAIFRELIIMPQKGREEKKLTKYSPIVQ